MMCKAIVLLPIVSGLLLLWASESSGKQHMPAPGQAEAKQERTDTRGDALPEGAAIRFGSARLRHGGAIRASALSPDGKALATAGDHSVIVWNLDTGKALRRFPCDRGLTFSRPGLTFSPDGKRLGYVRGSYFACVWDLRIGKELRRFERQVETGKLGKLWAGTCQFAKEGKEFVLVSREAIETWNVESGKQTTSVAVKMGRLLSPDGKTYLRIEGAKGLSIGDADTGKEVTRLDVAVRHNGIENGLAFSPDGRTLAIVHAQKEVQLRETAGGKVLASFLLPESAQWTFNSQKHGEYRVAFSADGKDLLLGTYGGLIHRWDAATGKELSPLSKHHCAVAGMHTLPDGRTLVSTGADGVIRSWDLKTGREGVEPASYEGRAKAAYSTDGRFAVIGDARGRIDLWDGRDGKLIRTLQQEGAPVAHLKFAPNGKLLAAAQRSGTLTFWHVPSGQVGKVWQREPERGEWYCNGIHFSPDGRLLCMSDYPKQIRVIDVASGKLVWKGDYSSHGEAFSPDGATLLVARSGPNLTMLDANTGEQRSKVRLNLKIPDDLGVGYKLAFSPEGRWLAVAVGGGGLLLCDGHSCTETRRLADGDSPAEREMKGIVGMGSKVANEVRALAFSPDGKWFASAGSDTDVYVWETATGQEVLRLPGHEAAVSRVAFSPNGKTLFTYGEDSQGYLWDLRRRPAAGPRAALNDLWTDLAGTDASKAYRAVWALSDDPRGVNFLRAKLLAAVLPDRARMAKLIAGLDSDRFEVREAATRSLAELAELAVPAMQEACKTATSLEQRKRLEGLLASLKEGLSPFQILQMRGVQVLELADTVDARQALREWARGVPAARLTQEAQAALVRLDKHQK